METKDKLKNITYSRSHQVERTMSALLLGESRWLRDIELLLEDNWSGLRLISQASELTAEISNSSSKVAIIEWGLWSNAELRLVEVGLPKSMRKVVVTHTVKDELSWRRLGRRLSELGVCSSVMSGDSKTAAEEVQGLLEGLSNSGLLDFSDEFKMIKNAYQGFQLSGSSTDPGLVGVARLLLSQFALPADVLAAGMLLAETFSLLKSPHLTESELFVAFKVLESSIEGTPAFGLLQILNDLQDLKIKKVLLTKENWAQLVENSKLGRLASRKVVALFEKVNTTLAFDSERKLKIA